MELSKSKKDIKFEELYDVSEWQVESPDGWNDIKKIGKTIPYDVWLLKTDKGNSIECADEHILYDENNNEKFCKDFKVGDKIQTKDGLEETIDCGISSHVEENMYDLQVDGEIYYANSFKSHNTLILSHLASSHLMKGLNVWYITLEVSDIRISERIDQNIFDMCNNELTSMDTKSYSDKLYQIRSKTKGNLRVSDFPSATITIRDIELTMEELKIRDGFEPDIIFIDYLTLLRSSQMKTIENLYTFGKMISEEVRGFAKVHNLPVVSAIQTNRSGYGKSDLDLSDMAESFAIAHTVDWTCAVIQTEVMDKADKYLFKLNKTRYSVLKTGQDAMYFVGVDKEKQRLYNLDNPKEGVGQSTKNSNAEGKLESKSQSDEEVLKEAGKSIQKLRKNPFDSFKF